MLVRHLPLVVFGPVAATVVPWSSVGFIGPGIAQVDQSLDDAPTLVFEFVDAEKSISVARHESKYLFLGRCCQSVLLLISLLQQVPKVVCAHLVGSVLLAWSSSQDAHGLLHPAEAHFLIVYGDLRIGFL